MWSWQTVQTQEILIFGMLMENATRLGSLEIRFKQNDDFIDGLAAKSTLPSSKTFCIAWQNR